jgi:DNA-binding XRE family transcriptional regulator
MRKQKKKRLESKGWKIGTVKEFLGLSNEESAYIELKIKLAAGLRQRRQQKGLSQLDLAAKLQSSQSSVAKMEAGDPSVSLDLLIRSLISLGATERELQLQELPEGLRDPGKDRDAGLKGELNG